MTKEFELIQQIVSEYTGVSVEDILTRDRHREFIKPRFYCIMLSYKLTKNSLQKVANHYYGKRGNHTSVMHAVTTVNDWATNKDTILSDQTKRDLKYLEKRVLTYLCLSSGEVNVSEFCVELACNLQEI